MLGMGWDFDHRAVCSMNAVRWVVLHNMLQEREMLKVKSFVDILKQMLGVEVKEGVLIPLSAFINPEIYQKLSQVEFGFTETEEGNVLSEDDVIDLIEEMDSNE